MHRPANGWPAVQVGVPVALAVVQDHVPIEPRRAAAREGHSLACHEFLNPRVHGIGHGTIASSDTPRLPTWTLPPPEAVVYAERALLLSLLLSRPAAHTWGDRLTRRRRSASTTPATGGSSTH